MLEFIASNINSIFTIIAVLFVIGIIGVLFCAAQPFYDEYVDTFGIIALLSAIIGLTLLFNISTPYPVSNAPWKTIYKNDYKRRIFKYLPFTTKRTVHVTVPNDLTCDNELYREWLKNFKELLKAIYTHLHDTYNGKIIVIDNLQELIIRGINQYDHF